MVNRKKTVFFTLSSFLLFIFFFTNLWAKENISKYNKPSVKLPDKQIDIAPPMAIGPFYSNYESSKMERVMPFYTPPFADFKITFDSNGKKFFDVENNFSLKGKILYSSEKVSKEVKKMRDDCLASQKDRAEEQRNLMCQLMPTYSFPEMSNVSILVQVWRADPDKAKASKKGDYLVDEFYGAENLTLKSGEEKGFEIKRPLVENLAPGQYYASFFVNQYKSFTLFNYPVNVFAPLVRFDFDVAGEGKPVSKTVLIDKDNIKINGQDYSAVLPPPLVKEVGGKVKFEVPVKNLGDDRADGKIAYTLQKWTEEDPKDILASEEEGFTLEASGERVFTFEFTAEELDSFGNLQLVLETAGAKSMTNVHFALAGKNRGVIRFLGISQDGRGDSWPFFCLRNAQWQGEFEGKLKLDFFDQTGKNKLAEWSEEGVMEARDGVCFVLKDKNLSNLDKNNCLMIKGTITDKSGKIVDEKEVFPSCSDLQAKKQLEKSTVKGLTSNSQLTWTIILGALLILMLAVFIKVKIYKK